VTDEEKATACELAKAAGADYVKTSTALAPAGPRPRRGADAPHGRAGDGDQGAGGIRSFEEAQAMIAAGATRIGASASVKIVQQAQAA